MVHLVKESNDAARASAVRHDTPAAKASAGIGGAGRMKMGITDDDASESGGHAATGGITDRLEAGGLPGRTRRVQACYSDPGAPDASALARKANRANIGSFVGAIIVLVAVGLAVGGLFALWPDWGRVSGLVSADAGVVTGESKQAGHEDALVDSSHVAVPYPAKAPGVFTSGSGVATSVSRAPDADPSSAALDGGLRAAVDAYNLKSGGNDHNGNQDGPTSLMASAVVTDTQIQQASQDIASAATLDVLPKGALLMGYIAEGLDSKNVIEDTLVVRVLDVSMQPGQRTRFDGSCFLITPSRLYKSELIRPAQMLCYQGAEMVYGYNDIYGQVIRDESLPNLANIDPAYGPDNKHVILVLSKPVTQQSATSMPTAK